MDYPQAAVSVLIFTFCVIIGLPVWWNTTKVHRAPLPQQQITDVKNKPVMVNVQVDILVDEASGIDKREVLRMLKENKQIAVGLYRVIFNFNLVNMASQPDSLKPDLVCKHLQSVTSSISSEKLHYRFYMLADASLDSLHYYCDSNRRHDTAVLMSNVETSFLVNEVFSLLKLYTNAEGLALMSTLRSNLKSSSQNTLKSSTQTTLDMPPAIGYRIVLTLAVANPADYMPQWNVEEAIAQYLSPVLSKLSPLGQIKVSSQVLYYVDFKEKPRKSGGRFFYKKAKLPILMNEIRPRLNTYTSTETTLNFIVYVPPAKYVPLFIKSDPKDESLYSAFHSARWGGFQIYNPVGQNSTSTSTSANTGSVGSTTGSLEINNDAFVKTVVIQLAELFGMNQAKYLNVFPQNRLIFSEWSVTRVLITKNFEYLSKCVGTLASLYKLLGEIENIVISEEIRHLIENALDNYDASMKFLVQGEINASLVHSKAAFENSEKAFYDSSLLALLYFPDDQKYAIYIPLFLPAAFPIISSVYRSVIWLKKHNLESLKEVTSSSS